MYLNMLNNDITINPDEIRKFPDNSIMDTETIRQIGLYSCKTGDNSLNDKIKQGLEFAALYPHVMTKFDIETNVVPMYDPSIKRKLDKIVRNEAESQLAQELYNMPFYDKETSDKITFEAKRKLVMIRRFYRNYKKMKND